MAWVNETKGSSSWTSEAQNAAGWKRTGHFGWAITSTESGTTSKDPFTITITFDEPVIDFDLSDFYSTNCTLSSLAGSSKVYTASCSPSYDGKVEVAILYGVVTDDKGNKNSVGTLFTITKVWGNNYSLALDGTDDYVHIAGGAVNLGTTNTISLWAKWTGGTMQHQLCGNKTYGGGGYLIYVGATYLYARIEGATCNWTGVTELNTAFGTDDGMAGGNWTHIMLVRTGTETFKLYVNGAQIPGVRTLGTGGSPHGDTLFSLIGCGWYIGSAYNEWIGNMDEVALFSDIKVLADAEAIYNSGAGSDLADYDNLVAYWRLEEGTGTSIADSSANSNTGTLYNSTWSTNVPS